MSKITDFYSKAISDSAANKELADILNGTEIQNVSDEQIEKIGILAKKLGFDITADEAREYLNNDFAELDDDDLDAAAGGKNQTHYTEIHVCEVGGQAGYDDNNNEPTVHPAY